MSEPVVELDRIAFRRIPDHPLFENLSFTLREGERFGLTGPNGSGKSTLLLLIMGLLRPRSGSIRIFGEPRRTEAEFAAVRGRVGLLFQDPDDQLFCPSLGEDVAFGPRNLGMSAADAAATATRCLEQVGLAGFEQRAPHRLSEGEKRRAALAGVLAMAPRVLLLDEPTAGLDADGVDRIASLLDPLEQAMLVVSHDLDFLKRIAASQHRLVGGRLLPLEAE